MRAWRIQRYGHYRDELHLEDDVAVASASGATSVIRVLAAGVRQFAGDRAVDDEPRREPEAHGVEPRQQCVVVPRGGRAELVRAVALAPRGERVEQRGARAVVLPVGTHADDLEAQRRRAVAELALQDAGQHVAGQRVAVDGGELCLQAGLADRGGEATLALRFRRS